MTRATIFEIEAEKAAFKNQLSAFDRILEQKAKRVFALQNIDQFNVDETEGEKIRKQLSFLEPELQIMFALRGCADNIENAYTDYSGFWYEGFQKLAKYTARLEHEIHHLKLDLVTTQQCLDTSTAGELIYLDILLKNSKPNNAVTATNPR